MGLNRTQILQQVKAIKTAVAKLEKDVVKEAKRIGKAEDLYEKRYKLLEEKVTKIINGRYFQDLTKEEQDEVDELRSQQDSQPSYDDALALIGTTSDYPDDSILGSLASLKNDLDELVRKEGLFVSYFAELKLQEKQAKK